MSQNHYSIQDYADKYREILLKVPEHIPDFLQVHKFVLGLKETLRPLVRKEKCSTLDKAIELAIVLEDGKKFTPGFGQKFSWTRVPRSTTQSVAALPSTSENRGKESRELHMIKTSKGEKRKVSAMAERAFNRSMLSQQQRDKAMKEGLCYGCLGKHKFKECPKRSKITANMVVNPMQEVDDSEEDLLDSPYPSPKSQRILAISVTKKVSSVPDAVLSPGAQQGYQFPDTELIVLKGTLNDKPVKILFDTGSTHNVISSKLVKKLKLPTRASNYSYTVELADKKGTEVWDRQVADLLFKIQFYEDRMDFEITRLARFDMVLGKQWLAWKKPTIDFSSHVIQFEHEGRRLLIRGELDLFIQNVFRLHGMPLFIVSDRDVRFTGHFWTQIFQKLNVKLNMSSGDHPQTDGQTERVNQILEDMLRAYVSDRQTDWDTYLPLLEFAYNNRPHRVTGLSPFEMNYGMSPLAPDTIGISKKCPSATEFLAKIHRNMQVARQKLQQAADRAKSYAIFNVFIYWKVS
ncbi:hypothetical protein L7F22_066719 [Adiantum nelumboides]|nr:hypothetical protein [Adiantum nelumboides]